MPLKKILSLCFALLILAAVALLSTGRVGAQGSGLNSRADRDDKDRLTRSNFDATCATTNYDATTGQASCTIYTIPAGSTAVIESLACTAEVAAGQGPGQADLIIPYNGTNYYFALAMTQQTTNPSGQGVNIWAITNQIRAYGNAPTSATTSIGVFFRASLPNLSPPQGMFCTVAGYVLQP
jgi:hypothetical protein